MKLNAIRKKTTDEQIEQISTLQVKSDSSHYKNEEIQDSIIKVKIENLQPSNNQPRVFFDELAMDNLKDTIKQYGIRQPLVISKIKNSENFEIISGERRWRAAKDLGISRVPCIILQDKINLEEIAILENLQREDLHPIELGEAFVALLNKKVCTSQREVAVKFGFNKSVVSELISFAEYPTFVKEYALNHNINEWANLRKCKKVKNETELKKLFEKGNSSQSTNMLVQIKSINGEIKTTSKIFNLKNDEKKQVTMILKELLNSLADP